MERPDSTTKPVGPSVWSYHYMVEPRKVLVWLLSKNGECGTVKSTPGPNCNCKADTEELEGQRQVETMSIQRMSTSDN